MNNFGMLMGSMRDSTRVGPNVDTQEAPGFEARSAGAAMTESTAIDQLVLVCEAVWELASEKLGLTDEDLAAKVAEIDERSGMRNGRRADPARRKCPSCDAAVGATAPRCQWCGADAPISDPFAI